MVLIKDKDGKIIRRSHNLRAIMDHVRNQSPFATTTLQQCGTDNRTLVARFPDGTTCTTGFASASVLTKWIAGRIKYGSGHFKQYEESKS